MQQVTVITSNIYARWHRYFQRQLNGVQPWAGYRSCRAQQRR